MSMSVVALGLRYHARAMAPPNWWGTSAESSISWSETILGTRLGYRLGLPLNEPPSAKGTPADQPAAGSAAARDKRGL